MNEVPQWLKEAHANLSVLRGGETVDEFTPIDVTVEEIHRKLIESQRDRALRILPNPLTTEGRAISEDARVSSPDWLLKLLGEQADEFRTMPERTVRALEEHLELMRANPNSSRIHGEGEEGTLRAITHNFVRKMAGDARRQIETMGVLESLGAPELMEKALESPDALNNFLNSLDPRQIPLQFTHLSWRLDLLSSVAAWPLEVRTLGDVYGDFDRTRKQLALDNLPIVRKDTLPTEERVKEDLLLRRMFLPVEMDMLRRGFPLYPILIG